MPRPDTPPSTRPQGSPLQAALCAVGALTAPVAEGSPMAWALCFNEEVPAVISEVLTFSPVRTLVTACGLAPVPFLPTRLRTRPLAPAVAAGCRLPVRSTFGLSAVRGAANGRHLYTPKTCLA